MSQTKPKNSELEEELNIQLLGGSQTLPYKAYEREFSAKEYHYYLSEPISEPKGYTDMIHQISIASSSDVIVIHLNTVGGQLDTGVQIINAMQNSQAKVITVLEGVAHSLGTLIFLAGDEMIVNDHCVMMFHNFSAGVTGKGNEMVSELTATVRWFEQMAKDFYIPFMSEDEFNRMIRGEDFWLQSDEIKERLDVMMAAYAALAEMEPAEEETE